MLFLSSLLLNPKDQGEDFEELAEMEVRHNTMCQNCYKEMDSLFDNRSWSVDLHSDHNSKTDVAVGCMC